MEALLVMCPQNSFFNPKGAVYMGEKADTLRIRLEDYVPKFNGMKIFFREKHAESDEFFVNDKTHSIVNTFDFFIIDSLKKYANVFIDKTRYSAFFNTEFSVLLKKEKIISTTIVGVETHTSVLFTAEELRNRGISVSVIEPLVTSRNDFLHNTAITLMNNFLGVCLNA